VEGVGEVTTDVDKVRAGSEVFVNSGGEEVVKTDNRGTSPVARCLV
jgi:hypothetical protein